MAGKMPVSSVAVGDDDARSEYGGMFEQPAVGASQTAHAPGIHSPAPVAGVSGVRSPISAAGVTRAAPSVGRTVGKGPVGADPRKFKYDRVLASTMPQLEFSASKADRMDASDAGGVLDRIHRIYGIDREGEDVIAAFDKALFFEHTINGASLLQPGRGLLSVGSSSFELATVKDLLGVDQRRFFRAYADEIADVNREVLASYDPYDPVAAEKYGQLVQVAVERGLQKYPHLAHDSSDAGLRLSVEERVALMNSKRSVLTSTVNNADKISVRAPADAGTEGTRSR
jgi:hypothetical protein